MLNKYDLVFDLDLTIIDSFNTIFNIYNKIHHTNIHYNLNDICWDFKPFAKTKEEVDYLLSLFDDESFYDKDNLIVFENAINILNKLSQNYSIAICSKHKDGCKRKKYTTKWLKSILPKVDILLVDDFEKGKYIKSCSIFVDDRLDCLESMKSKSQMVVCYGLYDWNKEWKFKRVLNWIDLENLIFDFFNKRK